MKRLGGTATGLLAALALALPGASAASVAEVSASAGPAAEEYLEYRASKGEANRVQVNLKGRDLVIVDRGVKRITVKRSPFGVCRATGAHRVVCPNLSVFVILRDGNDTVAFAPGSDGSAPKDGNPFAFDEEYEDDEGAVNEATYVDGGSGDDRIKGTTYNDVIVPGPGRDKVFARGGNDDVYGDTDDSDDHLRGGGGADALHVFSESALNVDLVARTVVAAGTTDSVADFERVHGGPGADVIRGTDRSEAIYGEGGIDRVEGRGGSDLLFGDSPSATQGHSSTNTIVGGDGDDFIDARSRNATPVTPVDCGPGADVFTGEVDDRPDASCEQVAFRLDNGNIYEVPPDFDDRMAAFPVAREPDGDPVYAVSCPPSGRPPHGGCSGTLELTAPADPAASYGSAPFAAGPGETVNAAVALNAAGRAAVAAGEPVAVRVSGQLAPPANAQVPPLQFAFGWQHVIAP